MVETLAEFLFYLAGGVPLALSFWIIPYIIIITLTIAIVAAFGAYYVENKRSKIGLISIPAAILVFFFGMGAPLSQTMMLEDNCIHHEFSTPHDNTITVTECKVKDNYYAPDDDFVWKIK